MEYGVDYYIDKFSKIPERLWLMNTYGTGDAHCAYGHCGMQGLDKKDVNNEANALYNLVSSNKVDLVEINDGWNSKYQQSTPKQRILAVLYDIRDKQIEEANLKATKELINQPSKLQKV